jgi:hypothetical protein
MQHSPKHYVHRLFEIGDRHCGQRSHLDDAGVVDEDVDQPNTAGNGLDE